MRGSGSSVPVIRLPVMLDRASAPQEADLLEPHAAMRVFVYTIAADPESLLSILDDAGE